MRGTSTPNLRPWFSAAIWWIVSPGLGVSYCLWRGKSLEILFMSDKKMDPEIEIEMCGFHEAVKLEEKAQIISQSTFQSTPHVMGSTKGAL